jgi:hypothetical protein
VEEVINTFCCARKSKLGMWAFTIDRRQLDLLKVEYSGDCAICILAIPVWEGEGTC